MKNGKKKALPILTPPWHGGVLFAIEDGVTCHDQYREVAARWCEQARQWERHFWTAIRFCLVLIVAMLAEAIGLLWLFTRH